MSDEYEPDPNDFSELTENTKKQYVEKVDSLARRFIESELRSDDRQLEFKNYQGEFIDWMVKKLRMGQWSKSTFYQYRSAVKYVFEKDPDFHNSTLERLYGQSNLEAPDDCERRTQAQRLRHYPEETLQKVIEGLRTNANKLGTWSEPLIDLLKASILTGLRPMEWNQAELQENQEKTKLIVKNEKYGPHRAHGEERTIYLDRASRQQLAHVRVWLKVVNNLDRDYETVFECIRKLHTRKVKEIWDEGDPHPTIKSCRHQFCANAKAAQVPPEEVAAMMGHATDATAMERYGRKVNGDGGRFPAQGEIEEIEKVKSTYENRGMDLESDLEPDI
jgi:integrase